MSIRAGLWVAVLAFCQGCGPLANSLRTTVIEPVEYCRRLDNRADKRRCSKVALELWQSFQASCPETIFSESFRQGFLEGAADYLYAGGYGAPPPVPPRDYWRAGYGNPEGHEFIDEWYAGFRRGAGLAQGSGYRSFVTVPPSTALPSRSPASLRSPASTAEDDTVLPPPRELPPSPPTAEPRKR